MRYLNNKDLFKIMRIVRKANIKQKLLDMDLPRDENGKLAISEDEYGMMMIFQVIESAPQAEKEIFEFLADVGEVEVKELEEDEFELLPKIIEHLQKQEKLKSFLEQAFKSTK